MRDCPNPKCNGKLILEQDYEWDYQLKCDTCPFWCYASCIPEFKEQFEAKIEQMERDLNDFVDNNELTFEKDWGRWEDYYLKEFKSTVARAGKRIYDHKASVHELKYWQSLGYTFPELEE